MKLIGLSLILILASTSNGQGWKITLNRTITATLGSDVTIWCKFTVPSSYQMDEVQVYWKKPGRSPIKFVSKDSNPFVFHTDDSLVLEKYRKKAELIGDKTKGDCSLKMFNIRENEPNLYVRVSVGGQNYSFRHHSVSISVSGAAPVTLNSDYIILSATSETTMETTQPTSASTMYMAIFIPVAALLIIISVAGIVFFCLKHKRSQSFTRQDSGYYVNFKRASSNQAKRDASHKKEGNKKLSEVKVIDEPIYINTAAPASWMDHRMDHRMDHTEHIYGNVDNSQK